MLKRLILLLTRSNVQLILFHGKLALRVLCLWYGIEILRSRNREVMEFNLLGMEIRGIQRCAKSGGSTSK